MQLSLYAVLSFVLLGIALAAPPYDFVDVEKRGYPARCPDGQTATSKGVEPSPNGCTAVPDGIFKACCNSHDRCYADCSRTKRQCDDTFYTCMKAACSAEYDKWYEAPVKATCMAGAATYHTGVAVGADIFFMRATEKHCTCS